MEAISVAESFSIRKQLRVFRRWAGSAGDAGRFIAIAIFVASLGLDSQFLTLFCFIVFTSVLLFEIGTDHLGTDATRHSELLLSVGFVLLSCEPNPLFGYTFLMVNVLATYLWAGLFKLQSAAWRRGNALPAILASRGFGLNRELPGLGRRWYLAGSWGIILLEIAAAPAFLFGSRTWCIAAVILLSCLHLAIGTVMGVRRFSQTGLIWCGFLWIIQAQYGSGLGMLRKLWTNA